MAGQKIRIRLKAYDHEVIDSSARKIVDTVTRTGATVAGPVPLPTEKNVFCVIRSPHKYKDSREHFEMRTHKRLIDIIDPTPKTVDSLIYFTRPFALLADSPIKKIEDLKGKVIGDNSIGGAMDIGLRAMLKRHGLEDKRDYTIVEIEFPNMLAAMTGKRVDLGFLTTPFSVDPMKSGQVHALFTEKDAMQGPSELTIIAGRTPYIKANRAALVDYFEDTNRAMNWILDPKNREAAIKLVVDFTKQPESVWSSWIFTKGDDYHAPDSRPDVAAMQKNSISPRNSAF